VAAVTDKTIVIPAHGNPVSNKAELAAYRDMLVAIRDNVAKLRRQGRSLDETLAAKPTAAFDAKRGQFRITPAWFTRLVYEAVVRRSQVRPPRARRLSKGILTCLLPENHFTSISR